MCMCFDKGMYIPNPRIIPRCNHQNNPCKPLATPAPIPASFLATFRQHFRGSCFPRSGFTWPGGFFREATARIHLIDGKVLVKNAKGQLLLEGEAEVGFWDSLWALMENELNVSYRATKADF